MPAAFLFLATNVHPFAGEEKSMGLGRLVGCRASKVPSGSGSQPSAVAQEVISRTAHVLVNV